MSLRGRVDANDVLGLIGLGLLAYGLWWVWWPLTFSVPGAILLLLAMVGAALRSR